ncbi:MAG TPA: (Fe-S)-binding protein [Chitinophagaceae bacterium]|nr:(Fe-S)-binding protein [Chitinophagaceae bacterium]
MNVQLFIPCFIDQLYPQVGLDMARVLEKLGCQISYNPNQTCCGQPAYNAGYIKEARAVSEKFVTDFSGTECIVAPSGSCVGYVRGSFDELFENASCHKEAKQVKDRVYEFSEFLVDVLKVSDCGATFDTIATYHDSCGALRECGIKAAPRTLLSKVKGLELREMKECETCCGFGGTFAVKYEPISVGMAQTKVSSALECGARVMISSDISCLMHMDAYIRHEQIDLQTMHIAEVLTKGW